MLQEGRFGLGKILFSSVSAVVQQQDEVGDEAGLLLSFHVQHTSRDKASRRPFSFGSLDGLA